MFSRNTSKAQNLIVRPYLGNKWYAMKDQNKAPNNLDPLFENKVSDSRYSLGIALELLYPTHSFELCLTSQQLISSYSLKLLNGQNTLTASAALITTTKFNQLQFLYNQYLLAKSNRKASFVPIISVGIGVGFLPEQEYFDRNTWGKNFYLDDANNSSNYLAGTLTEKRVASLNFSAIFKLGVALVIKQKEIFRIQAFANIGLNNVLSWDMNYGNGTNRYSGSLLSNGSLYGIQVSIPLVCLVNFNKHKKRND